MHANMRFYYLLFLSDGKNETENKHSEKQMRCAKCSILDAIATIQIILASKQ